jgi:hypothetical protein
MSCAGMGRGRGSYTSTDPLRGSLVQYIYVQQEDSPVYKHWEIVPYRYLKKIAQCSGFRREIDH